MITAIPLRLLWSLQIKRRQKIVIGLFLCLNSLMIVAACMRMLGVKYRGHSDQVWSFFWAHVEACKAVAMISITASRSFFVSRRPRRNISQRQWYASPIHMIKRGSRKAAGNDVVFELLPIPSAPSESTRTFTLNKKHEGAVQDKKSVWPNGSEDEIVLSHDPVQI